MVRTFGKSFMELTWGIAAIWLGLPGYDPDES
jgi:hypothetical protein